MNKYKLAKYVATIIKDDDIGKKPIHMNNLMYFLYSYYISFRKINEEQTELMDIIEGLPYELFNPEFVTYDFGFKDVELSLEFANNGISKMSNDELRDFQVEIGPDICQFIDWVVKHLNKHNEFSLIYYACCEPMWSKEVKNISYDDISAVYDSIRFFNTF